MKEITRIHIAKIPYDIELSAKHNIERYFKELELYARDPELMRDIEIRISEILSERGVIANGVITDEDIAAIKTQLGEPSDFKSDEDNYSKENTIHNSDRRKLFRDTDNAILGGVLSGIANYLNVDILLTRLVFLVLFVFSGGSFFMIYILFWIIMPPAKTASEKIRMTGKEVNLESIKEYSVNEVELESKKKRVNVARTVISAIFGSLFMIISISLLFFTMISGWFLAQYSTQVFTDFNNVSVALILGLMVMAGLLLALLFAIFSYSSFCRKFTKKIAIAVAIVVASGMVAFTSALGIGIIQASGKDYDFNHEFSEFDSAELKKFSVNSVDRFNVNVEYQEK